MTQPTVSVVVPTRNRAHLVCQTVSALCGQTFRSMEIIVVDNSDDNTTSEKLSQLDDKRIRIVRTGGLNMPENWETALQQGCGTFLLLVNDKTIFEAESIARLVETMKDNSQPFITFVIGNSRNQSRWPVNVQLIDNSSVVEHAIKARIDLYQRLAPKGTNCLLRREYLQHVRSRHAPLCRPVSPDYPLSTFLLESAETSMHLPCVLAGIIPQSPSNTHLAQDKPTAGDGYFETLGIGRSEFFTHVPVNTFLVNNILINDVLKTLEITRGTKVCVEKLEYYLALIADLIILRREQRPMLQQSRQVRDALRQETGVFRRQLVRHAVTRFAGGWPNRNRKMRHNFPDLMAAVAILLDRPRPASPENAASSVQRCSRTRQTG